MLLHALLRRMLEAVAADADLSARDVQTCLKDATKIVVSAVGEPEEVMSPDELTNIKELCHAAKCMATVLAHMRLEIDLLVARGSESAELREVAANLEQKALLQTEMALLNVEPTVKAKATEMMTKKYSALLTAQAKASASAVTAAKTAAARAKSPFVAPPPLPSN